MALEDLTGTKYIDDLNSSNPAAGDNVSEGDDHIRGIKNVLKTTFPSIDGAITATDTELNYVDGVTSSIQAQLDSPVAKGDGSSADGYIQLNCSQNSHGIKLQSPPHSAGASYTLVFPNDDGNANEMLLTNGSGVLDWTTVGTSSLAADAVTGAKIADDAIDSEHIAADSIDAEHYAPGSVDTTALGADAVTADKIGDDVINSEHIAADSIDAEHLAPNSVNTDAIIDDSVTSAHIAAGAVDTTALAADSVTSAKIADNVTLGGNVTVSGDLTVSGDTTTVNTATLAVEDPLVSLATGNNSADAVDIGIYGLYDTSGSQDLYSGLFRDASDSGKWKLFKDNQAAPTTTVNTSGTGYAVGTLVANIEGNVNGTLTAANSVDSDQYVDGSIDTAHIGDSQVTTAKIADDAITAAKLANSINTDIATGVTANTTANAALPKAGGTMTGDLLFGDNVDIKFGAGNDLEINHDGAHSNIIDQGTGDLRIRADNLRLSRSSDAEIYLYATVDGGVTLYHNGSSKIVTASTGVDVTGEVKSSTGKFSLNGNDYMEFQAGTQVAWRLNGGEEMLLASNGDLHVDGDVIAYSTSISDERLKDNIEVVEGALDKVKELKGVTFTRKQDGVESAGVIAQDVEKVLPQAVKHKALPLQTGNDELFKTVQYDALHALLIESIKELSARVEELESK